MRLREIGRIAQRTHIRQVTKKQHLDVVEPSDASVITSKCDTMPIAKLDHLRRGFPRARSLKRIRLEILWGASSNLRGAIF